MLARRIHLALLLSLACNRVPEPQQAQAEPEATQEGKAAGKAAGKAGFDWFRRKEPEWSFAFKDPPPGKRAPVTAAFLAELGLSRVPDAHAIGERLAIKCGDTSVRAMMDDRRKAERKRIEEARARGEDAVTAASWLDRRSKREANPQVRYSCPQVESAQLPDRPRPPSKGRLLYVFDSEAHPLRHASYQRTHKDQAAAVADLQDAVAYYTKVYGEPTKRPTRELPGPGGELPTAFNFETTWEFSDLAVKVGLLRYGDLITVGERVEVPHGIRPDAPRDGKPAPATPSAPAPAAPGSASAPTPPGAAAPPPSGAPPSPAAPAPATPAAPAP